MIHVPSFLVGSVFSGASFLLIHRELSHRTRLTTRWIIAEWMNNQIQNIEQDVFQKKVLLHLKMNFNKNEYLNF